MTEAERQWREVDEPARVRAEVNQLLADAEEHGGVVGIMWDADGTGKRWVPRQDRLSVEVQKVVALGGTTKLTTKQVDELVREEMIHR